MAFEKWEPQPEFERFPASATIVQSRLIRLPSPVANMLRLRGKVSANLYYDKKRKVIGIKPLDRKEEGAAKIRQSDKSTSIHVPAFFRTYDIEVPGIKRFHCWYDEKERIVIEPPMAFGTGEHETTRGVLRLLSGIITLTAGSALAPFIYSLF